MGHQLWRDVLPTMVSVVTVVLPVFGWHHWRISAKISRHMIEITATLDRKLKVRVEVDDANVVTIKPPAPDLAPPTEQQ